MIVYEEVAPEEIPGRILEIDVSEHGAAVYHWLDGAVQPVAEEWTRPRWTAESWRAETWIDVLTLPGVRAWGAFDDGRLVGIGVYRPYLTEEMAQLAALYVSRAHRRQGIAARLIAEVCRQAREDGFATLYVSATPSESAVGFYCSQGFEPTRTAHPQLFALEPEDIHMTKRLS